MTPKRKKPRQRGRLGHFTAKRVGTFLILAGAALIGYAALNNFFYNRALQPNLAVESAAPTATPIADSPPVHIVVPGLVDLPLEAGVYQNGQWTIPESSGAYLAQAAKPGQPGNIIMYGHNRAQIFGRLTRVPTDSPIVIRTADGKEHQYKVISREEVSQDRTDLLAPTNYEILTIYTCSGWLDAKRFVVRAIPA
jgi:sortase family protein